MFSSAIKSIMLLLILVSLCACGSYRPVNMKAINNNIQETDAAKKVKNLDPKRIFTIGDTVKITTRDGKFYQLKVTSVSAKFIHGKKHSVEIQNIAVLETKNYRTVALASAGAAGGVYFTIVLTNVITKAVFVLIAL